MNGWKVATLMGTKEFKNFVLKDYSSEFKKLVLKKRKEPFVPWRKPHRLNESSQVQPKTNQGKAS